MKDNDECGMLNKKLKPAPFGYQRVRRGYELDANRIIALDRINSTKAFVEAGRSQDATSFQDALRSAIRTQL
jgi:hypothetical protein